MKRRIRIATLLVLIATTTSLWAESPSITLKTRCSTAFSNGLVHMTVSVRNIGTETAFQIQPTIQMGNQMTQGVLCTEIPTNGTFHWDVVVGPPPAPQGIHTLFASIRYADAKGFPLSTMCIEPVTTDPAPPAPNSLSLRMESLTLRETSSLILTLKSSSSNDAYATIHLALPAGQISSDGVTQQVTIPARGTTTLSIPIHRGSCLQSSRYVVYAWLDADLNGKHFSTSALAQVRITDIPALLRMFRAHPRIITTLSFLLFLLACCGPKRLTQPDQTDRSDILILAVLFAFMAMHLPWHWIFSTTMTVGGDTVSHQYLASHLKDTLLHEGRIISWAPGWWSGFPAFQYYFCLPYLLMAALSMAIPMTIAFKLVTVLGMLMLPVCAYLSARWMKLPKPGPALLAITTTILLFDDSNTMWGVNAFSTLAGMISDSMSFSIMLLFIGSAVRDADDGRFRLRTVLFMVLMLASHFFTSIIGCVLCLVIPFISPKAGFWRATWILGIEAILGLLLMAWWIVPLLAKQTYSVDFGSNWVVHFWATLPFPMRRTLPLAAIGVLVAVLTRNRFGLLHFILTLLSLALFFFGYTHVSPVFVNVRLWPFILYGLTGLVVTGMTPLFSFLRRPGAAVFGVMLLVFCWATPGSQNIASWARWNYTGAESKPLWPVYQHLVIDQLKNTPGRLAYDLAPENESLGSSRIFESVPYRIGKPILEGGIVNSAEGSLFAYVMQGEISTNSAGWPSLVKPAQFNWPMADRHLDLFNVKHFIARWSGTRAALAADPQWRKLAAEGEWELYERISNDGHYVVVPTNEPLPVRLDANVNRSWQKAGLAWFYAHDSIDQLYLFLDPKQDSPRPWMKALNETEFSSQLNARRTGDPVQEPIPVDPPPSPIMQEDISSSRIHFVTRAIGEPHLIKISYYPNWKVTGARTIYRATPSFMLVYPEQAEVTLTYGSTRADELGHILTALGWLCVPVLWYGARRTQRRS